MAAPETKLEEGADSGPSSNADVKALLERRQFELVTGLDDAFSEGSGEVLEAAGEDGRNHPAGNTLPAYARFRSRLLAAKVQLASGAATSAARFLLPPCTQTTLEELPQLRLPPPPAVEADPAPGARYMAWRRALLHHRFRTLQLSVEGSILQRIASDSMQRALAAERVAQEAFAGGRGSDSDSDSGSSVGVGGGTAGAAAASAAAAAHWSVPRCMYDWAVMGRLGGGQGPSGRSRAASQVGGGSSSLAGPATAQSGGGVGGAFASAVGTSDTADGAAFANASGGGSLSEVADATPRVDLEQLLARRYVGVTCVAFSRSTTAPVTVRVGDDGAPSMSTSTALGAGAGHLAYTSASGVLTLAGVPSSRDAVPAPSEEEEEEQGASGTAFDVVGAFEAGGEGGGDPAQRTSGPVAPRVWATVAAHTAAITAFHWAPSGDFLVTAGLDRCLRLWQVTPPTAQDSHTGSVHQLRSIYRSELLTAVSFFPLNANLVVTAGVTTTRPAPSSGEGGGAAARGGRLASLWSAWRQEAAEGQGDSQEGVAADTDVPVDTRVWGVLHVLNVSTGQVVQSLSMDWPITTLAFAQSGMQLFYADLAGGLHCCNVPLDLRQQQQHPLSPPRVIASVPALVAHGPGVAGSALGAGASGLHTLFSADAPGAMRTGPCRVADIGQLWRVKSRSEALLGRNAARAARRRRGRAGGPLPFHGSFLTHLTHKAFDSRYRCGLLITCSDEGALLALQVGGTPPHVVQRALTGGGDAPKRHAGAKKATQTFQGAAAHADARIGKGAKGSSRAGALPPLPSAGTSSGPQYAYVASRFADKRPRGDDAVFTCVQPCSGHDVLGLGTASGECVVLDPHAKTITRTYVANLLAHAADVTACSWSRGEDVFVSADASGAVVFWRQLNPEK